MPAHLTPSELDPTAKKNIEKWLEFDPSSKDLITEELNSSRGIDSLNDRFYADLKFGTGGMRGLMGIGTNRMNALTVSRATQGLANYILKQKFINPSVLIGYDCRHHSKEFAEIAAKILIANGIAVFLFSDIRPTPLVSFGCRHLKCSAAIMITASHNPPQYNGYKVFWSDGGQIIAPEAPGIIEEVSLIEGPADLKRQGSLASITSLSDEIDNAYIDAVRSLALHKEQCQKEGHLLNIIYTSLQGTGITLFPKVLRDWGFTTLQFVKDEIVPDGNFSAVVSPNPEEEVSLKQGIALLDQQKADILMATDPDADRVAVVCRHEGRAVVINGHTLACLCLDFVLSSLRAKNQLPKNGACIKSLVTTDLFKLIAESYGVPCFDVLTGFKHFAEKIRAWKNDHSYQFIFGGEESLGYLWGTLSHDKDALTASLLIADMALDAKLKGKTLVDLQNELYLKHGHFYEKSHSVNFPETQLGQEEMLEALKRAQEKQLFKENLEKFEDYSVKNSLDLPKCKLLTYALKDGSKVMVRPSGTEPKVKIYVSVNNLRGLYVNNLTSHADSLLHEVVKHLKS